MSASPVVRKEFHTLDSCVSLVEDFEVVNYLELAKTACFPPLLVLAMGLWK
jgi:hypothetical protein